jgi:hypothetical protein
MTEISGPSAVPTLASSVRASAAAGEVALKLLQPLEGLLQPGESADAEVLAVKQTSESFQALLRLTLESGRQTILAAATPRALELGSAFGVLALSESSLIGALHNGAKSAAGQPMTLLDLDRLPPGTLLQGKVSASQPLPRAPGEPQAFKVIVSLLNTAQAGSKLVIETNLQLGLGSLLTAEVKGSQALNFLPLSGRLDQLELGQQLTSQASRQGSLENLARALFNLGSQPGLPEELNASLDKLLASMPDIQELTDPKALARAIDASGLFLEAKLLQGRAGALPEDLKANLLRLIAQLAPGLAADSLQLGPNSGALIAQALPAFVRNALGALGQAGARQQAMGFPLPAGLSKSVQDEGDLESLLKLAAAAVSRLQTHQLSSLAQSQVLPDGTHLTSWQLELPMRHQQDLVPLQIKLRKEQPPSPKGRQENPETIWKVELAFDLAPLGPLQVQAQLVRGALSSQLWAEQARTAELIEQELSHLRERLVEAGLRVGELACRQGQPPKGPRTTLEQRWVDDTA